LHSFSPSEVLLGGDRLDRTLWRMTSIEKEKAMTRWSWKGDAGAVCEASKGEEAEPNRKQWGDRRCTLLVPPRCQK